MKVMLQTKSYAKALLTGISLLGIVPAAIAQWTPVGPAIGGQPYTEGQYAPSGDYNALTTDTSGRPYVAYWDPNNGNKVSVRRFDDTGWSQVGPAGLSDGGSMYVNIARSHTDTMYVAYRDAASGTGLNRITVKKFDGTSWVNVGANKFSAGTVSHCRIVIAPNGTPYVCFGDFSGSGIMALNGKLTVMKFDGTAWVNVGPQGFTPGPTSGCDIKISSAGEPYVVYGDNTNSGRIAVRRFDGTNWVSVGTNGFSTGDTRDPNIVFDSQDVPYVAFRDIANSSRISVMKFNGTDWDYVGNAGFSTPLVVTNYDLQYRYCVLDIDSKDRPYVAYTDAYANGAVSVMRYDGNNWNNVGQPGFSHNGKCLSINIHKTDLYVSYIQNTVFAGPWPGYTWKYDICDQPSIQELTADKVALCKGDATTIRIDTGVLNDATEWNWYSGSCGGTAIATGDTLRVAPGDATVYYVRGEGGCVLVPPACDSVKIDVNPLPDPVEITVNGFVLGTTLSYHAYQWYKDGVLLLHDTNATYTVTENAVSSVKVSNESGCTDSTSYAVNNVGIADINQLGDAIRVYPNPAYNALYVTSPITVNITLSSIGGKQLINTVSGTDINIGDLADGIYILHITDGSGIHIRTEKVVKMH